MTDTNEENVATAVAGNTGLLPEAQEHADVTYNGLLAAVKANLLKVNNSTDAIFLVDVKEAKGRSLFTHYLNTFPEPVRPQYNCRTCAQWLKLYGQQVLVNDGVLTAFAFTRDDAYAPEVNAVLAILAKTVESCVIVAQKADNNPDYVIPSSEKFNHFSGRLFSSSRHLDFKLSGAETVAKVNEWREAVRVVTETLNKYKLEDVQTFSDLFKFGQFSHAKKFVAEAKIFSELHQEYHASKHTYVKTNLVWEALGKNFTTLFHFNGSSVGALLDYIAKGQKAYGISEFKKYTDGINFKRPTELPTEREIELATKRVNDEGLASAFKRRFATVDDIQYWLWKPAESVPVEKPTADDLFGNMKKKDPVVETRQIVSGGNITLVKFIDEVLPKAKKIVAVTPRGEKYNFAQMVAATDPDAKPLLKFDKLEHRNTVSQYIYHEGSTPAIWFEDELVYHEVLGITTTSDHWSNVELKFGVPVDNIVLILKGAKDRKNNTVGLFPEIVKDEYRDLRRVIEEYSRTHVLDEVSSENIAAGLLLSNIPALIKQTAGPFTLVVSMQEGADVTYSLTTYL